jgi:selenium donor protein
LKKLPRAIGENILVGNDTADDAAVYRINENQALVQTVDFFTPMVDDPYIFGCITAANALSDVYAMGAEPSFALNIVAFPSKRLPMTILEQMLMGAHDTCQEAGIPILGGHTIEDNEPKLGLVVSGLVHPNQIWKNQGAEVDDYLILTKPIGLGIMTTALKRGLLNETQIGEITAIMRQLNRDAARAMKGLDVHACTDITGFGLLGHLCEMMANSKLCAELWFEEVPVIREAIDLIAAGVVPGGTQNNLSFVKERVWFDPALGTTSQLLLADAQTSGGLLFSVPATQLIEAKTRLDKAQVSSFVIGRLKHMTKHDVEVKPKQTK